MLANSQRIHIKDKFFYDALIHRLDECLPEITCSKDLAILGLSLSMNITDFKKDHLPFLLRFYQYVHQNRFLLAAEDKRELSRVFNVMNLATHNKKHLDLFQKFQSKEMQKQAFELFKIKVPDTLLLDFDFENRVVIMKNKVTKQMIIIFGSEHNSK